MTRSPLHCRILRTALAVLALSGAWPAFAAFTDNGDGTVTDTATGLMWDQCSWGLSGAGCATGGASTHTWPQALGVAVTANAMNGGVGYKNHNDWRLPNVKELESLVKIDTASPAIDTTAFPNTKSSWYRSATIYTSGPVLAWSVYFNSGYTNFAGQASSNYYVRLVRGGQPFDSFDALPTYPITVAASPSAGGTASCTPNPVDGGGASTCTATPNEGYSFTAWSGDCTGATCVLSNVTSAKNVTAGFVLNTYAIATTASPVAGGTVSCTPNPVDHGGASACTATPNAGYSFTGWSGDCSGASCVLSGVTSARSVTAGFVLDTYAVATAASPLAGGTVSCSPNPVDHGGASTCTAMPNAGYGFTSWSGDCSGATCALSNVTSARSVTATFTPVTSYTGSTPSAGDATISVSGAGCVLTGAQFIAAPAGAPTNTSFPYGLADFALAGCVGGTATVTITYPTAIPAGAGYWKEVGGVYTAYPATLGANSVTFTLTDGGAGDSDGVVNGTISDPSGVGVTAAVDGGAQPIPVLAPWGMAVLSGLLGLFGVLGRRRRV